MERPSAARYTSRQADLRLACSGAHRNSPTPCVRQVPSEETAPLLRRDAPAVNAAPARNRSRTIRQRSPRVAVL